MIPPSGFRRPRLRASRRPAPSRGPIVLGLIAALTTVAVADVSLAAAAAPAANGPILFVTDRDSVDANGNGKIDSSERNREVYAIDADGTGLRRLTDDPATDTRPALSPNGRTVAFDSGRSGNDELWIMTADGSGTARVTDRGAPDRGPSFSSDGQRLAYSVTHKSTLPGGAGEGDIWTVNADGTETTRLTFDRELDELDPAFSPDGSKIAFVSATPGGPASTRDILVVDADGSNPVNLTAANGGAGAEDSDPSWSPDGSKIAFTSDRGGGAEIWVMGSGGGNPTTLTSANGRDEQPAFSPDGTRIVFTARRGGSTDLYTMNADGSAQTRLTDDAPLNEIDELGVWRAVTPPGQVDTYIDSGPAFVGSSPQVEFTYSGAPALGGQVDGFNCSLDGGAFQACPASGAAVAGLSDGAHTFVVRAESNGTVDPTPARYRFAVDTTRIVFASDRDGNSEIYVIDADGTAPRRLTNHAAADSDPALSPDGSLLAFASQRDGDYEIYVTAADGSGTPRKLTDNQVADTAPTFSPDGASILFTSRRDGNDEVYAIDAETGAGAANLTRDPAEDRNPSLSGDGSTIVFQSNRAAGNEDIYSMAADGSAVRRLTDDPAADSLPDLSPDGTQIVFTRRVDSGDGSAPNDEVWRMDADGSGQINITNHPRGIHDREPSYRPDGAKVVYQDAGDIYLQNLDGTARTRLTAVAATDSTPDWGPATVDTGAPQTTITSGPGDGSTISDPTPSFGLSSNEPSAGFECRFDSAPFAACSGASSHTAQTPLADGPHVFEARAVDAAGNRDDSPARRSFTVDTGAPQTTITSGPGDGSTISDPTPSFGLSSNEPSAGFECRFDSAPFAACSGASSHTAQTPLADGPHVFEARAVDAAGNRDDSPARRSFTVDTGAPQAMLCAGEAPTIVAKPGMRTTGTTGADVILGTSGPDLISAKGGSDLICTLGGDDNVSAAGGDDRVYGEAGADVITGGGGSDLLFGGAGADHLDGEAGHDELDGGADWDQCIGGGGNNLLLNCES